MFLKHLLMYTCSLFMALSPIMGGDHSLIPEDIVPTVQYFAGQRNYPTCQAMVLVNTQWSRLDKEFLEKERDEYTIQNIPLIIYKSKRTGLALSILTLYD